MSASLPTAYASVSELKQQLRIDGNEEDSLLQLYLDSALDLLEDNLNRKVVLLTAEDSTEVVYDNAMKVAHLQIAGDQYKNRELTSDKSLNEVPTSVAKLIESRRTWFGGKNHD